MSVLGATLSVLCFALAACQPSASTTKIYGGRASAPGSWPGTVAVTLDGRPWCSGTLVAPTLVITAGHCLVDDHPDRQKLRVVVGNDVRSGTSYGVAGSGVNPGYLDDDAATDFAYLKLAQPASSVPLVRVLTDPQETRTLLAAGMESTLVGFGDTETDRRDQLKYEAVSHVVRSDDRTLLIGGNDGTDTCFGDSGGPAYGRLPGGEWRVYGITSTGVGLSCGTGTLFARIADGLCWISAESGVTVSGNTLACAGSP